MKRSLRILFFCLSFLALSCGPQREDSYSIASLADARNVAWVARHGLTSEQYQSEFDRLVSQGFRPISVSGYAVNNSARYAAIFEHDTSGIPWVARHGITSDQYQQEFNYWTSLGYRPVLVNGYEVGGQDYYAAIWEFRSGPAWSARHGLSAAAYQEEFNNHVQAGYRLIHVSGYSLNGQERYAAIWEQSGGPAWVARHGLSANAYQAEFDYQASQGYRLVLVSAFTVNGQDRFAAIWEQRAGLPWIARHGLDGSSYQAAFDDYRYQGYRPAMVSGYGSGSNALYAAIWHNTLYSAADLNHIDNTVETVRKNANVPAISIAIAKDGRLVFAKAYGYADKDQFVPAHSSSLFRIASISKPITATAILKLVDAGRLSLDQKVFGSQGILGHDYGTLPYSTGITDITVRHLLQHTAGGWANDSNDPMFLFPEKSQGELISWVLDNRPLDNTPGTMYAYSNFGYSILGRVIEKVSGQSYEAYTRSNVLGTSPQMSIAGDSKQARKPNEVLYYDNDSNAPYSMKVTRMDAHGGWLASPIDLVRFGVSVDAFATKPDQLSSTSLSSMITGSTANPNYGLGWALNSAGNYWHDGSLPGTASILVRTSGGFVWSAVSNSRSNSPNLDAMMWSVVNGVGTWPTADFF